MHQASQPSSSRDHSSSSRRTRYLGLALAFTVFCGLVLADPASAAGPLTPGTVSPTVIDHATPPGHGTETAGEVRADGASPLWSVLSGCGFSPVGAGNLLGGELQAVSAGPLSPCEQQCLRNEARCTVRCYRTCGGSQSCLENCEAGCAWASNACLADCGS